MNQPPRPQPPQRPAPPAEPEMSPAEILQMSVGIVKSRLSTARSIAMEVFGQDVDNETVLGVYDRLDDQINQFVGTDDGEEEE